MDKIIVGFSTPKKFHILPWLIRKIEKTEFSHVYIKWYSDIAENYIIYQASGLQVNFCNSKIFECKNKIVDEITIDISKETKKQVVRFALDNAGIPYGIKQILGIGAVYICKLFGKYIKNPFADGNKSQVCSELVARILIEKLGVEIKEDLDIIGPRGIYEYVCKIREEQEKANN